MRYVLFSGIALAMLAATVVILKAFQRHEPREKGDYMAPNVLNRINTEYRDL